MIINEKFFGDLLALTKPRITIMAMLVALAGIFHAKDFGPIVFAKSLYSLLGIALLVSASSSINMYLERNADALMERTKKRPLPAKRLKPIWAILMAFFCLILSCPMLLYWGGNGLTFLCGFLSFLIYAFFYTPFKQKSWTALLLGSVPGAMPVVLGYLAHSNAIDKKSLALFLWAFLWQIPHFLSISLFRQEEYTKAGFPVLSYIYGESFAKNFIIITSWSLVISTLGLFFSHVFSNFGLMFSIFLGAWFLYIVHNGFKSKEANFWAKRVFKATLIYQTILFFVIIAEGLA